MADDRPDDAPRFTSRTLLTPEDDAGDGAQAFGTGDIDDDALDAIVEDATAEVGEPLRPAEPVASDGPADASGIEEAAFVWASPVVPEKADLDDAAMESEDAEGVSAPIAAPLHEEDPFTDEAEAMTTVADEEIVAAPPADEPDLEQDADPFAEAALDDETDAEAETGGLRSTISAAGAQILGAAADIIESPRADDPESIAVSEGSGESEVADEQDVALEPNLTEPDASSDEADLVPVETEADSDAMPEVTAQVDDAFDSASDADKADAEAAVEGVVTEGDLDVAPLGPEDFEPEDLLGVLRTMLTSRRLDEKMLTLLKQGKGFFHIGSAGHEASQTAVARKFEGGSDWFCFYYRDLATALTVGVTPTEILRAHFGKADDPFGGGRQMPEHFGHRELNIMSTSSSVGAQYVPAVGFGLAVKREDAEAERTRAVYASGGEGSTSQGAFHEALNWAAREALPVLFHIQDNKYAISVPVEEQTAGGSIWHLLGGYAGLRRIRYDGTDFFASAAAARAAMDHIRAGNGPVALHADLVRLLPHSSSDDHKKYRASEALDADRARDPIPQFVARLVEAGVVTEPEVDAMRAEIASDIDRLAKEVEKEADPDPATATAHVYYEGDDDRVYEVEGETGELVVMVDAINHAMDEEMARDERVLVFGEDVGGGKGGVFTATRGLTAKHGADRCFNSPLAEHSILGSAVGLACAGYKPVVEIQFADYIWPGMQPLRNQIASMRYRSDGDWACPMVIRVPAGGYIHGGLCHSQNVEAIFGHFPGLHVVMPSNAADAKGLLKSAIRGHDPVLFLEHKALYRQGPARRPEPHDEYLVPLGKAAVAREGSDLTIVTWGAIVYKALNAAKALEKEGVSVEVIDVRSFLPFDAETVLASVKKTGRVLIAYEDHEFMGFGAEIAAQVADAAFGQLDAPVKRVAGAFSSIPYADALEKAVLPQDDDVLGAAREVLAY